MYLRTRDSATAPTATHSTEGGRRSLSRQAGPHARRLFHLNHSQESRRNVRASFTSVIHSPSALAVASERTTAKRGAGTRELSCRLIAGHVAEPARVDRQGFAQHEFHAEVGGAGQRCRRMILLKPRTRRDRVPPGTHKAVHLFAKNPIGPDACDLAFLFRVTRATCWSPWPKPRPLKASGRVWASRRIFHSEMARACAARFSPHHSARFAVGGLSSKARAGPCSRTTLPPLSILSCHPVWRSMRCSVSTPGLR
jgi:hypothetical protein